jgi:hypothetical protein
MLKRYEQVKSTLVAFLGIVGGKLTVPEKVFLQPQRRNKRRFKRLG